jgi:hypothetical protein
MPAIPTEPTAPYGAGSRPTIADPLFTLSEFAAHCRVSVFTVRRAIRRGELRVIRVTPRRYVIRLSEGERYLVAREAAA